MPGQHQFLDRTILGDISRRAGFDEFARKRRFIVPGQRNHLAVGIVLVNATRSLQAADTRQMQVHQHHMRLQFARQLHAVLASTSLPHDLDIGHACE